MQPPSRDHSADLALIAAICGGDRAAWQRLVETFGADLRGALRRALLSRGCPVAQHTLEDLEADLWLGLVADSFRRLSAYSGRCGLRQWLKVVASNHVIDFLRRQRPTVSLSGGASEDGEAIPDLDLPSADPDPLTQLEDRRQADTLRRALDLLSDEDRLFVELYYQRELSFERVAELMSTTVGATYARKNRLRKRILSALQADAEGDAAGDVSAGVSKSSSSRVS
jgi:RNA polymerase sigma factor (sigma-70 family)